MKFSDFFRADSTLSSGRLGTIGSIVLFIPCFVVTWTVLSFQNGELQNIPSGVEWFLGVLLGGKIVQTGIEVAGKVLGAYRNNNTEGEK